MKTTQFIIRYRKLIIILTAIIVLLSIIPLFNMHINADLESYMPDDMQSKIINRKIAAQFSNEETLLIILETDNIVNTKSLQRIQNLTEAFQSSGDFHQIHSLFQTKEIRSEDGMMVVNPLIPEIPENKEKLQILEKKILNTELANGLVVSSDLKQTLIMLSTDKSISDKDIIQKINEILQQYPGNENVYITGQAFLREEANDKIGRDIMFLLPLGLLVMLVFLWVSFRQIKAVLLPFSVVIISILIAMSMIPLFGWELSLIGVLIPIMMIAIANNYGVHFVAKYQEMRAFHPERSNKKLISEAITYLKKPVILCGLTTIVGTLGLVVHLLIPASQMGIISAIAIGFALLLSLTYIPALMACFKSDTLSPEKKSHIHSGFFYHFLKESGSFVSKKPLLNIILFSIIFIFISLGIISLQVAPDSNRVLPEDHSFNKAIQIADSKFGGSKMIQVMFTGDAVDPTLLQRIETYSELLEKNPMIGKTASLSTILKEMSKALNDSTDAIWNQVPKTREGVSQYLELYTMNADAADLERFVTFDNNHLLWSIQFKVGNLTEVNQVLEQIRNILKDEPNEFIIGGSSLIDKELSESVKTGQIYSMIFAFVAIFLLLALIFKSMVAGLIGSIPLLFAVCCTFGIMGWTGIDLNIVTALLSSISIGLGVDFTIHIFWRLKRELAIGKSWKKAIQETITGIGRGISINAFSVMLGFSVLFFSAFPLIQSFAMLIIISLLFCLISALFLIPAICLTFKPKFLEKPENKSTKI